jgi:hypothetical protein
MLFNIRLVLFALVVFSSVGVQVTLRSQYMSKVGRQEWLIKNTVTNWNNSETAFVIVDMWNKHW